ncbi:hypothetical protein A3B85_00490 [Candidatus Nomurabacteria bacterium RIFCSPHIGHO2_02_FULL_37_13]|uniref:GGDEF domain-containing protein n=1 Tax=Candidatus Nomurabacteria bacterium RIFCSPHIGHO2_02_FULL_37_13 TaxID=1801750 RepID=A0A1F6W4F5_9BACT|nr:MAG: hypothetical protein A2640_01525 [Candidatus Nomurabacteria bacterium RIFCSPHIGHO2_01_FULL_36_23]OGI76800.1 MAG: hypothetical protein A3B85_00490 [Candidatus Nomurabacteria bacterium RIFCSPHIGHO2_02_FULL_37_13]OGI87999.1 MAG: hypothetical protein A2906_02870 [Candidatus Nomurabacteria bacterium RIFCSPLOWO2_01_FULL_37_25]
MVTERPPENTLAEHIGLELKRVELELAVANARIKTLENERGIDVLTGLPNRLFLKSRLGKLIEELNYNREGEVRKSVPIGIIVFQIDLKGLKSFNKNGQVEGDKALVAFADLLRHTARNNDMVFRIGGDEFIAIFPIESKATGTDLKEVFEGVVERIQDALSNTAYMGYSIIRKGENLTTDELLITADQEMVKNKKKEKTEGK